jgi:hypothetical protein
VAERPGGAKREPKAGWEGEPARAAKAAWAPTLSVQEGTASAAARAPPRQRERSPRRGSGAAALGGSDAWKGRVGETTTGAAPAAAAAAAWSSRGQLQQRWMPQGRHLHIHGLPGGPWEAHCAQARLMASFSRKAEHRGQQERPGGRWLCTDSGGRAEPSAGADCGNTGTEGAAKAAAGAARCKWTCKSGEGDGRAGRSGTGGTDGLSQLRGDGDARDEFTNFRRRLRSRKPRWVSAGSSGEGHHAEEWPVGRLGAAEADAASGRGGLGAPERCTPTGAPPEDIGL